MTYQVVRFTFFIISIGVYLKFSRKYIIQVTDYISLEGQYSIDAKLKKTVKSDKDIEIARIGFHIIGFAIMALAFLPIKDHTGNIYFNEWEISLFFTSLVIFSLGMAITFFTWTNLFESKYIFKNVSKTKNQNELIFRTDINIINISNDLVLNKQIIESYKKEIELFLGGEKNVRKIIWISKAVNHEIEYLTLFDLLNNVIEGGVIALQVEKRKYLVNLICENFMKGNEVFKENTVNSKYTTWSTNKYNANKPNK